jgi:hypothetical protein
MSILLLLHETYGDVTLANASALHPCSERQLGFERHLQRRTVVLDTQHHLASAACEVEQKRGVANADTSHSDGIPRGWQMRREAELACHAIDA